MNKLYSVHDHWTDINKKNDVDIESIDGVITGIKVNGEDYGGGITWESVYSGTIDPDGEVRPFTANVSLTMTASDTIKVVYDNTEYILPKQIIHEHICYGATAYSIPESIDFSNCPFLIQVMPNTIRVYTETAGTHTLTISEPASGGGSSDFSTAEVTINKGEIGAPVNCIMPWFSEEDNETNAFLTLDELTESWTVKVPVGGSSISVYFSRAPQSVSGDIQSGGDVTILSKTFKSYVITGDCTITIS